MWRSASKSGPDALRTAQPSPALREPGDLGSLEIPRLKPAEFEEIRRFAKQRFGLDLRHGKEELVSARLARGMRQGRFSSFRDYLSHVESDHTGQALVSLINALTTNHTSFYREPDHFEFLASEILPGVRPGSDLRIWSSASSTGEEPYTIACAVAQHWSQQSTGTVPAPNAPPARTAPSAGLRSLRTAAVSSAGLYRADVRGLRILATDISTRVLETAKAAVYADQSLDPAPAGWRQSFFTRQAGREGFVKVRPELTSSVEFRRLNLIEPIPFQDRFHIIFCRNVMIYFDKATQEGLVQRLSEHLEPGGYLFVGHSESLAGVSHPLRYVRPAVYRLENGKRRLAK